MNIKSIAHHILQLMRRKPFDTALFIVVAIVVIKLTSLYFSVNVDDGNWNQFKTEHNCQLQVNGSGTQRSSWLCEDGKAYYRWRQQR